MKNKYLVFSIVGAIVPFAGVPLCQGETFTESSASKAGEES
jgi:hypothetical protein